MRWPNITEPPMLPLYLYSGMLSIYIQCSSRFNYALPLNKRLQHALQETMEGIMPMEYRISEKCILEKAHNMILKNVALRRFHRRASPEDERLFMTTYNKATTSLVYNRTDFFCEFFLFLYILFLG